ncbi:unnamed protein product [Calicophoron daubneyi]|uniref:Cytochrome c biogenesis B n=1 Tax=Calicophoron daubneyi TaxID=300641 RepID=A0AAV2U0K3_CALDB
MKISSHQSESWNPSSLILSTFSSTTHETCLHGLHLYLSSSFICRASQLPCSSVWHPVHSSPSTESVHNYGISHHFSQSTVYAFRHRWFVVPSVSIFIHKMFSTSENTKYAFMSIYKLLPT